jgi:hypothetical protein
VLVVAPTPAPATIPAPASAVPRSEPPIEELVVPADSEPAEAFIHAETERVQNVLNASTSIADEVTKAKVFETCMQRIQLLSSLRTLVEGAGVASRVATAMRSARTEPERLVLVGKLFGPEVAQHWAPKTAAQIVLEPAPQDGESDRVLRDTTGKYTEVQKKRALYLVLSRSQPTEAQQLGLGSIIESFLP